MRKLICLYLPRGLGVRAITVRGSEGRLLGLYLRLSFFYEAGTGKRNLYSHPYLMFRHRLLIHYINHTLCISLCRQDNVRHCFVLRCKRSLTIISLPVACNSLIAYGKYHQRVETVDLL